MTDTAPTWPADVDDDFMLALHEWDIADVAVTDGTTEAGPDGHGHNTVEEMDAHELTPAEHDGLPAIARADGQEA